MVAGLGVPIFRVFTVLFELTYGAYTCTLQDAIITSLQAYNSHIDTLKEEMDEATGSAEEIRKEIHGFRNK